MFASTELARRIEQSGCRLLREAAAFVRDSVVEPIGGGAALFAGADSPLTKVFGIGFAGPIEARDLERIERAWAERGAAVNIELATLAEAGVAEQLSRRGYVLAGFEDVLGRRLDESLAAEPLADGVSIAVSDAQELQTWIDVSVEAFAQPDGEGVSSHEPIARDALRRVLRQIAPRNTCYLARRNGVPAAAASMTVVGDVMWLNGMATLPEHRRHGLQTALLAARLADARARGAEIATVTTLPGSKSKQNVERRGFSLLCSRAVMRRAPAAQQR